MPDKNSVGCKLYQTVGIVSVTLFLLLLYVFVPPVYAHKVYLFAWVEGDMVHTDSYFPNKKKVIGGLVEVYDSSGKKQLEGKTDEEGAFSFKILHKTDLRIVLTATMGHKTEFILKADEMEDVPDKKDMRTEEKVSAVDLDRVRSTMEDVLDSKLKPIIRTLARIQEKKGPGFSEIVGGIGYIIGIMGIVLYYRSRKKD